MSSTIYYTPLGGDGEVRLDLEPCPWRHTVVGRHAPDRDGLELRAIDDFFSDDIFARATETIEDVIFLTRRGKLIEYVCKCWPDPAATSQYIILNAYRDVKPLSLPDRTAWREDYREVEEARLRELGIRLPDGLAVRHGVGGPGEAASRPSPDGKGFRLTPARRRILEVLRTAGERMTKARILDALKKSDPRTSEPTVRIELTNLGRERWIDNNPKAQPRGYGLTGLGKSILKTPDGDSL